MKCSTFLPASMRASSGYYMNDSGILSSAPEYEARPSYSYENGEYVFTGYLNEASATNVCPSSSFTDSWVSQQINYHNTGNQWTIEEVTMDGPTGQDMTVYKVTVVPQTGSGVSSIPISSGLNRGVGNPLWSVFLKNDGLTSSTTIQLGVPGQSLCPFDLYTMQWTDIADMISEPSYAWYINGGREEYANGWYRIGVGGICSAGQFNYNAAFYVDTSSMSAITEDIVFYMCLPCAVQYEPTPNYMSSYIEPQATRDSDSL